jgi:hypothetical protein
LISIEGNKLATDFSMFAQPLDVNMAYSFHIYTWFGDDWRKVLAWMDHPLFHRKPGADETRRAMEGFLEAVKLGNADLDDQMVRELLRP